MKGDKRPFERRRALVAGGTSGIGAELARLLLLAGADVAVIGRPGVRPPCEALRFIGLDLDKRECLSALEEEAAGADILCVVRGEFLQKPLDETTAEDWEKMALSNLVMPGVAVSAALPAMKEKRWGRILLFGGTRTEAVRGFLTNAAYAAAKTGLSSLVHSVAEGYGKYGVCCCGICPGFVDAKSLSADERARLEAKMPTGALIPPEKIAQTALYLLQSFHLNGCIVTADCAWTPQGAIG